VQTLRRALKWCVVFINVLKDAHELAFSNKVGLSVGTQEADNQFWFFPKSNQHRCFGLFLLLHKS